LKRNSKKRYFFGFSRWKRKYIRPFFPEEGENYFCNTLEIAKDRGLDYKSEIYIWGKKSFPKVEKYAQNNSIALFRVEDGFVRSISLGSDLTKPYSLVVDSRGIYFDPTHESDLEYLLNTYEFDEAILERAKKLQQYLIEKKLSKYNASPDKDIVLNGYKENQLVVLVPGQVEDDASIIYGAKGMTNLDLLQVARSNVPNAYIIYKPHPDVLSGNRKGHVSYKDAMKYADIIITDVSLDSILVYCDEVHTMTSLVGFEALIRGKKVCTYGMPFYAGWGLTEDNQSCKRRYTQRNLDELVAAAFLLYPRYIDPVNDNICDVEVTIANIELMKKRYNTNVFYRIGMNARNLISRKMQLLLKVIFSE